MHPVTIGADGAVVPGGRPFRLINRDIDAMPGEVIQVVDIGGLNRISTSVLVGMAAGAQVGRLHPEVSRARVLDVVDAMTIGADRDIRVILPGSKPPPWMLVLYC